MKVFSIVRGWFKAFIRQNEVIGFTSSRKKVYNTFDDDLYCRFTDAEHNEAVYFHFERAKSYRKMAGERLMMNDNPGYKHYSRHAATHEYIAFRHVERIKK